MFHEAFCMRFRAVLVASNATHFLGWWISKSLALGVAIWQQGYTYNFHVISNSLGRIRLTGNMICGWPRNSSSVEAAHVLRYLPWYHECTERNVGSRPLGLLSVLECFQYNLNLQSRRGKNLHCTEFPRMILINFPIQKEGGNMCIVLGDIFEGFRIRFSIRGI